MIGCIRSCVYLIFSSIRCRPFITSFSLFYASYICPSYFVFCISYYDYAFLNALNSFYVISDTSACRLFAN